MNATVPVPRPPPPLPSGRVAGSAPVHLPLPHGLTSWLNHRLPLVVACGFMGLSVAAFLAMSWGLPLPQCWLRQLTGVPCPSCGCTRSLAAWAQLDLAQAFLWNPLFFVLCAGLLGGCAVAGLARLAGRTSLPVMDALQRRFAGPGRWWLALLLVALNWLYLCLALPK